MIMPRPKGKPRAIAWKILGVPANIASKPTEKEARISKIIDSQQASLVR